MKSAIRNTLAIATMTAASAAVMTLPATAQASDSTTTPPAHCLDATRYSLSHTFDVTATDATFQVNLVHGPLCKPFKARMVKWSSDVSGKKFPQTQIASLPGALLPGQKSLKLTLPKACGDQIDVYIEDEDTPLPDTLEQPGTAGGEWQFVQRRSSGPVTFVYYGKSSTNCNTGTTPQQPVGTPDTPTFVDTPPANPVTPVTITVKTTVKTLQASHTS